MNLYDCVGSKSFFNCMDSSMRNIASTIVSYKIFKNPFIDNIANSIFLGLAFPLTIKTFSKKHYFLGVGVSMSFLASSIRTVRMFYNSIYGYDYVVPCEDEGAVQDFLKKYEDQLDLMQNNRCFLSDGWNELSRGNSKRALEHPELPGCIIKLGLRGKSIWGGKKSDLQLQFENIKDIREKIADQFSKVVIPNSYLFKQEEKEILVESKFDFYEYCPGYISERNEALIQLAKFVKKAGLCVVSLGVDKLGWLNALNAGLIRIAPLGFRAVVYDFDCRE